MNWVTWERVGVDRIGCAWLIRKFVDAQAHFLFIPRGAPMPAGAEPFDVPGVKLTHHAGHCSFDAILKEYNLTDPILARIARIIDEADTVQPVSVEPAAPGLDLICEGLRLICEDDQSALDHGGLIYDAVYARLAADEEQSS